MDQHPHNRNINFFKKPLILLEYVSGIKVSGYWLIGMILSSSVCVFRLSRCLHVEAVSFQGLQW